MKNIRIIPRLDIKGPNLVKGIHLEGLRVLGKPWDFALKYYEEGADELIYIDAVASLYGRNNLTDIVKKTAENIFIPLTVGGGIRSTDDIRSLLRAGADKVAINTEAVKNPKLISEGAIMFGSQCIVASIQAKKINDRYIVFTDNARESTDLDVFEWAKKLEELGAGELIVTSIDQEGTGRGYDIFLTSELSKMLKIPVIACGGCGTKEHLKDVILNGHADAVSASSIFHYHYLQTDAHEEKYMEEGNIEFLKKLREGKGFMTDRLTPSNIVEAKKYLSSEGINCRI
jgi:cyclase